jgi:hypothetical protein
VDLRTYLRVIWRFRLVVLAGFVLAVVLALFSYVKLTSHGITYRQSETWKATTTLVVNGESAPIGTPGGFAGPNGAVGYSALAFYYSGLVNSDPVQQLMARRFHVVGNVQAAPDIDPQTRITMPFITLTAFASKPVDAVKLVNAAAQGLDLFARQQQNAAGTPRVLRVALPELTRATGAALAAGRRKTTPIVIFLTVMIAAIGLAFILENLRPRVHIVGRDVEDTTATGRRSA